MLVDLEIVGLGIRTPELFPFGYSSIETVIIQLEEFISKRLNSCILDPISDELVHNARQLNFNHSVLEHYSSKTLNRRLKERCGVGQGGTFKNIVRFHKSLSLILTEKYDYADIAYMSGYYDQSHFIKSFKSHTGLAPCCFL